jgi:hypothetical protein
MGGEKREGMRRTRCRRRRKRFTRLALCGIKIL